MSWLMILAALMPLLQWLITWLSGRTSLTDKQQAKLNSLIHKCNQIRDKSCSMGCKPEGTPEAFEAGDIDIDACASELVDAAIADGGHKGTNLDIAVMKSKLSELLAWLRSAGVTWDKIFSFVSLVLPMIISGQVDWTAIWEFVKKLFPQPTPGPLST